MPNIEVYGYRLPTKDGTCNPAGAQIVKQIWDALEDADYRGEVVVTAIDSGSCNDPKEGMPEKQHFVRVWATSQKEVDDIVGRLDPLDIDIELPPLLDKFIERKSMRVQKEKSGEFGTGMEAY